MNTSDALNEGTVSVVVPVYKAEAFLEAAVASALALPEVLEVILVEDGSPDNSLEVCSRLEAGDGRVVLLQHPGGGNRGAGASRNLAIGHARGSFVAFLDADDVFLPQRFGAERRIFAEHPDADGVYGAIGVRFHSEAARQRFVEAGLSALTTVSRRVAPEELFRSLVETGKGFGYFSIVGLTVRRNALHALEPVFRTDLLLHQDTDFLLRLAFHKRLYAGTIDAPVALRGVHASNRITHNPREAHTRHLLYGQLHAWARTAPMEHSLQRKIEAEDVRFAILDAGNRLQVLLLARRFVGKAWLLNVMDVRRTYFDRLFGQDSTASSFFQKIIWRLLNRTSLSVYRSER